MPLLNQVQLMGLELVSGDELEKGKLENSLYIEANPEREADNFPKLYVVIGRTFFVNNLYNVYIKVSMKIKMDDEDFSFEGFTDRDLDLLLEPIYGKFNLILMNLSTEFFQFPITTDVKGLFRMQDLNPTLIANLNNNILKSNHNAIPFGNLSFT